jgi:hypothetical protein
MTLKLLHCEFPIYQENFILFFYQCAGMSGSAWFPVNGMHIAQVQKVPHLSDHKKLQKVAENCLLWTGENSWKSKKKPNIISINSTIVSILRFLCFLLKVFTAKEQSAVLRQVPRNIYRNKLLWEYVVHTNTLYATQPFYLIIFSLLPCSPENRNQIKLLISVYFGRTRVWLTRTVNEISLKK